MDSEGENVSRSTRRRVAIAIIVCYVLVAGSLTLMAAWLLLPPRTVKSTGGIVFSNTLPTDSFSLEIKQNKRGEQTITIGNTGSSTTNVVASLNIPSISPPRTWSTLATTNDRNTIPLSTTVKSAVDPGGVCQAPVSTLSSINCSFAPAPTETRSFLWQQPKENWIAQRGSRWSVRTPLVSMNNVGYPSAVQQGMADPRATITAAVPLPSGSAVVSGPPLSWNYASEVAVFTYSSSGRVDAPLIVNYSTQYIETFSLFGIAALLGATLGMTPQIMGAASKRLKSKQQGDFVEKHMLQEKFATSEKSTTSIKPVSKTGFVHVAIFALLVLRQLRSNQRKKNSE